MDHDDLTEVPPPMTGQCRRNPPVRIPMVAGDWPWVKLKDWCGEFKRRDVARQRERA
jgi:hypothetical protein